VLLRSDRSAVGSRDSTTPSPCPTDTSPHCPAARDTSRVGRFEWETRGDEGWLSRDLNPRTSLGEQTL